MAELRRSQVQNVIKFVRRHFEGAEERHQHTGIEFKFTCPFCGGGRSQEVTFHLNPEKGLGHCFRANNCGWRGSVVSFISEFLKISLDDADKIVGGDDPQQELKSDLQHYIESLRGEHEAESPAMGIETVGAWINGAVPLSQSPLKPRVHEWLYEVRGYDPIDFCQHHNLYVPPQIGAMVDRVMFEIRSGRHRAYLMYAIDPHIKPKTLNPSGRVLSQMLYNYEYAKNGPVIFINEGVFDVARLTTYGASAVATFGVALQPEQAYLLDKTKAKEICLMWDNGVEKELIHAAVTTLSGYLTNGQDISIVDIPRAGGDPDEMSEEEFLTAFAKRRRKVRPTIDRQSARLSKYIKEAHLGK